MLNLKKATGLALAILMAITFMAQPLVVLADDTYGNQQEAAYYQVDEANYQEQAAAVNDPMAELFELVSSIFPEVTRFATLTEEAREIALYDFDYFASYMLATAPTRHMFGRLFGITMEEYLSTLRHIIYDMIPIPSFTAFLVDAERWADAPTDALEIAADYMLSVLFLFVFDTGGFGHFMPQDMALAEHTFFAVAYSLHHEDPYLEYTIQELEEMGVDVEWFLASNLQFAQFHYDVFNTPSVLWFYNLDPSQFDFDVDLLEQVGTMNEDNITTTIIEPGRIAYIHIESFMNNMIMDSEVLFPFYEEVQDFEHLIIDIRGNGGGMAGHFPSLVVSMLIGESISFTYPEFFVADERTADLFENPMSLAMANLYGVFPAAEFVQGQNMTQFNPADLAILDYVAVWNAVYSPSEYSIPFNGDIWLLVDEFSASASVMAAMISANTGFATVVGEPTSRVTGVIYTHVALPNTGVLFRIDLGYTTDQYGRSIEEFGVIPQVANFPGMDALETVMAIINDVDPADLEAYVAVEESPLRYIDGVEFIRLRYVADAIGVSVEWDGPNQAVIVTAADGNVIIVAVSVNGVVNYNGRVYVPVENIEIVLAGLLA